MSQIRLQKFLADLGHGSRRKIEQLIVDGRILINGKLAKLGDKVSADDQIVVDDLLINTKIQPLASTKLIIYHKPVGEICSKDDPFNRASVYDHLPKLNNGRWLGVGRLDVNTAGLYLFTNDGEFLNQLIQPTSLIEREYLVKINRLLTAAELAAITTGLIIDNEKYQATRIKLNKNLSKNAWYSIVVTRGRNHEVRKIFMKLGASISKLIRIRYGDIILPKTLAKGQYILLPYKDVEVIKLNILAALN